MDKEAARELVRELANALEDPARSQLVPIVRKAARLAAIVGDDLSRAIFEFHLTGLELDAAGTGRVSQLSPEEIGSAIGLASQDRMAPGAGEHFTVPLAEIERNLASLRVLAPGEKADGLIRDIHRVIVRIANRVGTFVNNVVMLLGRTPDSEPPRSIALGKKVFIGHGESPVWRELRDFLVGLGLDCIEFNTESQAGNTTCARLVEMLDASCFAFLVMTGEDAHPDGTVHARENVIHEVGLFQGRLDFNRAIVLLEKGCAQFSNIHGLTYIGFPKGKIRAASEDIRGVLEREGLLPRPAA